MYSYDEDSSSSDTFAGDINNRSKTPVENVQNSEKSTKKTVVNCDKPKNPYEVQCQPIDYSGDSEESVKQLQRSLSQVHTHCPTQEAINKDSNTLMVKNLSDLRLTSDHDYGKKPNSNGQVPKSNSIGIHDFAHWTNKTPATSNSVYNAPCSSTTSDELPRSPIQRGDNTATGTKTPSPILIPLSPILAEMTGSSGALSPSAYDPVLPNVRMSVSPGYSPTSPVYGPDVYSPRFPVPPINFTSPGFRPNAIECPTYFNRHFIPIEAPIDENMATTPRFNLPEPYGKRSSSNSLLNRGGGKKKLHLTAVQTPEVDVNLPSQKENAHGSGDRLPSVPDPDMTMTNPDESPPLVDLVHSPPLIDLVQSPPLIDLVQSPPLIDLVQSPPLIDLVQDELHEIPCIDLTMDDNDPIQPSKQVPIKKRRMTMPVSSQVKRGCIRKRLFTNDEKKTKPASKSHNQSLNQTPNATRVQPNDSMTHTSPPSFNANDLKHLSQIENEVTHVRQALKGLATTSVVAGILMYLVNRDEK